MKYPCFSARSKVSALLMISCGCILLAAGSSSRLGSPKQMLRVHGETLLHRVARLALEAALQPVCVVLGSNAEQHHRELEDLDVDIILNAEWQSGMSASIRAGVARLSANAEMDRILVLVCDQLHITIELIHSMLATSQREPQKIIACAYRDRVGVPCIFPQRYFDELMQLHGDAGARPLLKKFAASVITLPFPGGESDIDTREDASRWDLKP